MIKPENVIGLVLAGGQGRRMSMGEAGVMDKPLLNLAGRPLLAHILDSIIPQVKAAAINANTNDNTDRNRRFADFGLPIIADTIGGFLGPLAGILSGLDWAAQHHPSATHLASFPGDAPFLPDDLVARLCAGINMQNKAGQDGESFACASSFDRRHPVVGIWPIAIRTELRHQLVHHDMRKIDLFTADYPMTVVDFKGSPDPFFNVNRPKDRDEAELILSTQGR